MSDTRFSIFAQLAVVMVVVVCTTVLAAQGTIDATAVTTIYGAALGFAGAGVRQAATQAEHDRTDEPRRRDA